MTAISNENPHKSDPPRLVDIRVKIRVRIRIQARTLLVGNVGKKAT